MPVRCYQIIDHKISSEAQSLLVTVSTRTRSPRETTVADLLGLACDSLEEDGPAGDLFDPGYRYRLFGADSTTVEQLLSAHAGTTIVAETALDLSLCLDWYRHPDEDGARWTHTELGQLVSRAKYRGQPQIAGPEIAKRVVSYVRGHPVFTQVSQVAATPSSAVLGVPTRGLVVGVATVLSREFAIPLVEVARANLPPTTQKEVDDDTDPDENQRGTTQINGAISGSTLIVDDFMWHGSTVNEVGRAIRAAGGSQVYSLSFVKEYTGTRGFRFD